MFAISTVIGTDTGRIWSIDARTLANIVISVFDDKPFCLRKICTEVLFSPFFSYAKPR
jgi:hypothetical protein